jgi:hypothetical protein
MSPDNVMQRVIDIVSLLEDELRLGIVVSVDDIFVRFRNFPIKRK